MDAERRPLSQAEYSNKEYTANRDKDMLSIIDERLYGGYQAPRTPASDSNYDYIGQVRGGNNNEAKAAGSEISSEDEGGGKGEGGGSSSKFHQFPYSLNQVIFMVK